MDFMHIPRKANSTKKCTKKKTFVKERVIFPTFKQHYYAQPERFVRWSINDRRVIRYAMEVALNCLNSALNENDVQDNDIIKKAIINVIKILQDPKLEIYPLKEKCYGKSAAGSKQISINVALARKTEEISGLLYSLAKTLIHESFHIIGGCTSDSKDKSCSDSVTKEDAFDFISKKDIKDMAADYFAQFVMQCQ